MITIGTWSISGEYGYVNMKDIESTLSYAYESGLKSFDTAPNYGNGFAEFCLGNIFNGVSDIEINTKFGSRPFQRKSFELWDLEKSLHDSLYRLRRDSINILWLHNPRNEISNYNEIFELADEFKSKGLIKKIGLSLAKGYNYSDIDLFDEVQIDCSLLDMDVLIDNKYNKPFHARSPLYSGILSGKLLNVNELEKGDHRKGWLTEERLDNYISYMKDYTDMTNIDIVNLSRRFLFSLDNSIESVIFGVKNKHHIDDLLLDHDKEPLDRRLVEELIEYYKTNIYYKG